MARDTLYPRAMTALLLLSTLARLTAGEPERTVIDTYRGQYYGSDSATPSGLGMAVMNPRSGFFANMTPEAIKSVHGHFQHFGSNGGRNDGDDFPFSELKLLDDVETARGKPSMLVSATYGGKQRPVYFSWSLHLDASGKPQITSSYDQGNWYRAVNVRDPRFIKFFVNAYLRGRLWDATYSGWPSRLQNLALTTDNCSFRYTNYGVLDDGQIFQPGVAWDAPYARSSAEFLQSIIDFNTQLKAYAPDVNIQGNEGSMDDETKFWSVWQGFAGTVREDITDHLALVTYNQLPAGSAPDNSRYSEHRRDAVYTFYSRYKLEAAANKVAVLRVLVPDETSPYYSEFLRTSYAAYLLFWGPNSFFGPRNPQIKEANPASYASMRNALGWPVAPGIDQKNASFAREGYRLYSRQTEGGIVYLNWSGVTQTVTLPTPPTGFQYLDHSGSVATRISIPDLRGKYVLLWPVNSTLRTRAARPTINPRRAGLVTGPLAVTLGSETAGAQIYYTLDGSSPTSASTRYSGPFSISSTCVVRARAYASGNLESFITQASYTITSAAPSVEFHLAAEGEAKEFPVIAPLLKLSNVSARPISVNYRIRSDSTALQTTDYTLSAGTLTFNAGEQYRYFPIRINTLSPRTQLRTIVVELYSPVNAVLGTKRLYTYTIAPAANRSPAITSPAVATPSRVFVSQNVNFAVAASDPDGQPLSYSWRFGDGTTGAGATTDHPFAAPGVYTASVSISDGFGGTATSSVSVTVLAASNVIVDNKDANTSVVGNWYISSGLSPWASESRYSNSAGRFTFLPAIPVTNAYDVYVWWTQHPNRSTSVPHRVFHSGGQTTFLLNQRETGGRWVLLGTFIFNADGVNKVEVSSENGQACADAVKFLPQTGTEGSIEAGNVEAAPTEAPLPAILNITNFKATASATKQNASALKLSAQFDPVTENMPKTVTLAIAGVTTVFNVNEKGRGAQQNATLVIRRKGTQWMMAASLKRGSWSGWKEAGIDGALHGVYITHLDVTASIDGHIVAGRTKVKFSGKHESVCRIESLNDQD